MYIKKNKELSLLAEQQQKQPQKAVSSPHLTDWAGVNQKSQRKRAAQGESQVSPVLRSTMC